MSQENLHYLDPPADGCKVSGPNNVETCEWSSDYPCLWNFLTRWDTDAGERLTGRMSIYSKPGTIILVLADRQNERVAFFHAHNVSDALDAVESDLEANEVPWRPDKVESCTVRGYSLRRTDEKP